MEALPTDQICKILDISASNLSVRLHRARLLLRGCLERSWFNPPKGKEPNKCKAPRAPREVRPDAALDALVRLLARQAARDLIIGCVSEVPVAHSNDLVQI